MSNVTTVTVTSGLMKKEFTCDLFVGMTISKNTRGNACEQLIAGNTNVEGILSVIRMLKRLEDQLYAILPTPKELLKLGLEAEEMVQAMKEKDSLRPQPYGKSSDKLRSALDDFLDSLSEDDDFLKRLFLKEDPSGQEGEPS